MTKKEELFDRAQKKVDAIRAKHPTVGGTDPETEEAHVKIEKIFGLTLRVDVGDGQARQQLEEILED